MSDLSDYAEEQAVKWVFTDAAVDRPTNWYLALFTSAPGDDGGGVEVSGGGYARAPVTFVYGSNGQVANTADIEVSMSGEVAAVAIFDGSGNLLAHKTLDSAVTVAGGQTFRVLAGQLTVRMA